MARIYMDYNASTPTAPEVKERIMRALEHGYGNPSASHWAGSPAKEEVEKARRQIAELVQADPGEIVFTSGGTESNNHVLKGVFEAAGYQGHIITSKAEHPAVQEPCRYLEKQGARVTRLDTDEYGMVHPENVEAAIREDTILVSIMHANNEVGTINPIRTIADVAHRHDVPVHTDAAQSLGKIPVHVEELGVDYLTIAGHKLYAPKGIGALYMRNGRTLPSFMHGAGHEQGRRAGTENVVLAAALGEACESARHFPFSEEILPLRRLFWEELQQISGRGVVLNGHPAERLPNTLHVSFAGATGADILDGIPDVAASTGSACHAGMVELSPVLKTMGVDPEIGKGAVRFSLGRYSTEEEILRTVELLRRTVTT
ncbi:cysteine desulfurase family protein [Salibacterium sp. K-3]